MGVLDSGDRSDTGRRGFRRARLCPQHPVQLDSVMGIVSMWKIVFSLLRWDSIDEVADFIAY